MGMDRKRIPSLSRLQKGSRSNRRIQRKIYGKPESTSRRLCGHCAKAHKTDLSQFFPSQFALAIHRNKVGKIIVKKTSMKINPQNIRNTAFKQDVHQGLTDFPKHLSSKYIYDKNGDRLFQ